MRKYRTTYKRKILRSLNIFLKYRKYIKINQRNRIVNIKKTLKLEATGRTYSNKQELLITRYKWSATVTARRSTLRKWAIKDVNKKARLLSSLSQTDSNIIVRYKFNRIKYLPRNSFVIQKRNKLRTKQWREKRRSKGIAYKLKCASDRSTTLRHV